MAAKKVKLYVCPNCDRGFASLSALNGHMGTCKGTEPPLVDQEDATKASEEVSEKHTDTLDATIDIDDDPEPVDRVTVVEDEGIATFDGEDPEIPVVIIWLIVAIGLLVTGLLLFRERIYEFLRGRRPPIMAPASAPLGVTY